MGVILYMLVTGHAPFNEANDSETLTMILDCKYYLPPNLSPDCIELITRMLVREPEKRIVLNEIDKHRWFNELVEDDDDISTEELSGFNSSSSEENLNLKLQKTGTNPNNNGNGLSVINKRSKTKSKEKLLKMVSQIKRENLSETQNEEIIQCMVSGAISTRDEIVKALDEDQYNYITGTYYLLAERLIKRKLQKRIKRKQISSNSQITKLKLPDYSSQSSTGSNQPQQQQRANIPTNGKSDQNPASMASIPAQPVVAIGGNNSQYKRKISAHQNQRNKLIRQVEEDEESENAESGNQQQQQPLQQIQGGTNNFSQQKCGDESTKLLEDDLHATLQPVNQIELFISLIVSRVYVQWGVVKSENFLETYR